MPREGDRAALRGGPPGQAGSPVARQACSQKGCLVELPPLTEERACLSVASCPRHYPRSEAVQTTSGESATEPPEPFFAGPVKGPQSSVHEQSTQPAKYCIDDKDHSLCAYLSYLAGPSVCLSGYVCTM